MPTEQARDPKPARRSADDQRRLDRLLSEIFEKHIVFNTVLGLKVLSVTHGDVRGGFEMRPELVGNFSSGQLHGGVIASVLDAMGGLAVMVAVGEHHAHESADHVAHRFARLGTIDLRIDYLRRGLGKQFLVSTEVLRLGGRVGSVQMRLLNEHGTLLATGAGAYMVS